MEATNLTLAVIRAFKKSPPKNPSLLTRARFKYPQIGEKNKGDSVWHYFSTIYLLKKAGYKIKGLNQNKQNEAKISKENNNR